jgi:hypothetical protein
MLQVDSRDLQGEVLRSAMRQDRKEVRPIDQHQGVRIHRNLKVTLVFYALYNHHLQTYRLTAT